MNTIKYSLAGAVAAAFLGACSTDAPVGEEAPTYYDLTAPKYALADLELAFRGRDAEKLATYLSADFRFRFAPEDVGRKVAGGYVIPTSWGRGEFVQATRHMFERCSAVEMNCYWNQVGEPAPEDESYYAPNLPLTMTAMTDMMDGWDLNEGKCDYDFAKDAGGAWRLAMWWDRTYLCNT